jgi:hypothetical protein
MREKQVGQHHLDGALRQEGSSSDHTGDSLRRHLLPGKEML